MGIGVRISTHLDLEVYQIAFEAAREIFQLTRSFPPEERYSLTDQIRRSSRSVCANLAEAFRKRRYEKAFVLKLSDAEAEGAEVQVWLSFATDCGYLEAVRAAELSSTYDRIIGKLVTMINNPSDWTL